VSASSKCEATGKDSDEHYLQRK